MKSIISALTAAVLALSILGGCGAQSRTPMRDEARITPSPAAATTSPAAATESPAATGEPQTAGDAIGRTAEDMGDAVGNAVGGAGRAVGNAVDGAKDAVGDMVDEMQDGMDSRDGIVTDRDGIIGNELPAATSTPNAKR